MKHPERGRRAAEPETDISAVRVQLKSVFGVPPGTYLSVAYALGLVILLFFVLVYPGLRSRGTYVAFTSRPAGAAVVVDGTYQGATPVEVLVRAGARKLVLTTPFLRPVSIEREFRGPVFGTLFVKPRARIAADLEVSDLEGLLRSRLEEYADYAHEPAGASLARTARILASPPIRDIPGIEDRLRVFLAAAMPLLSPPSGELADYLRAQVTVATSGGVLNAGNLLELTRTLAALASSRSYSVDWLYLNLPPAAAQQLAQMPELAAARGRLGETLGALPRPRGAAARGRLITVAGVALRFIPGGVAIVGDDTPSAAWPGSVALEPRHAVTVPPFLAGETEVTNRQYAAFVEAVPFWSRSNLQALSVQGLADRRYLEGWEGSTPPGGKESLPVANVSYHAARAYCEWLSSRLPAELGGYVVRLPFEAEWEWAARGGSSGGPYPGGASPGDAAFRAAGREGPVPAGSTEANGYGLREVMGNVWEWCEDWYAPATYLMRSADPGLNPVDTSLLVPLASERVVRGGSWANEARQIAVFTRGSQPPGWSTPYLGFRVVAARAEP